MRPDCGYEWKGYESAGKPVTTRGLPHPAVWWWGRCGGEGRALPRTGSVGRNPPGKARHEFIVRYVNRRAISSRIPAPQHQAVGADMSGQRLEIAIAVLFPVLDQPAQLAGRKTDPGHLVVRRRQRPMWRTRRRAGAVAGREILVTVAGRAGKAGRAMAIGSPGHSHRVRGSPIVLKRRVAGDVAVLAPGVLEHLAH